MATRNRQSHQRDVAELGSNMMDNIECAGAAVKDMATDGIQRLRSTANEYVDQGRVKAREVQETVEEHVRDEPMKALVIAAAVGFLFGVFFVRR